MHTFIQYNASKYLPDPTPTRSSSPFVPTTCGRMPAGLLRPLSHLHPHRGSNSSTPPKVSPLHIGIQPRPPVLSLGRLRKPPYNPPPLPTCLCRFAAEPSGEGESESQPINLGFYLCHGLLGGTLLMISADLKTVTDIDSLLVGSHHMTTHDRQELQFPPPAL